MDQQIVSMSISKGNQYLVIDGHYDLLLQLLLDFRNDLPIKLIDSKSDSKPATESAGNSMSKGKENVSE